MRNDTPFCSAVIVAAGDSSRMGLHGTKQLIRLFGVPVLLRTLRAFESAACIDEIGVVCRREDMPEIEPFSREIRKVCAIVAGGATRQASVWNGIAAISPHACLLYTSSRAAFIDFPGKGPALVSPIIGDKKYYIISEPGFPIFFDKPCFKEDNKGVAFILSLIHIL